MSLWQKVYLSLGLAMLWSIWACQKPQIIYDVFVVNCSGSEIQNLKIKFGRLVKEKTNVSSGVYTGYLGLVGPVPDEAQLSWQDAANQKFEQKLNILGLLPGDFHRDEIVFQILRESKVGIGFRPSAGNNYYRPDSWRAQVAQTDYCSLPAMTPRP